MMKRLSILFLCAFCVGVNTLPADNLLAFPGAEGFGRYATGGRYGSVYHVTNLKDSGTGSLRDAVSQPNRIVVFDVSGVIVINSRLIFSKNLYVAGQTAPGEGITVYGNGVSFSGATNTIVRYLRIRMGKNGDSGKDAAGVANGTTMIFDHLSVSWGLDETFSINSDGGTLGDITIQNSIMSQGLLSHSAGGLMQADNITLYRNLYVDNSTRNNKVKGKNQYVNNIVYNWKNGCYLMGGDSSGESYCNATNNLFINGPAVGGAAFTGGNSNFHLYAADNWQDKNRDGVFNPYSIPQNEYSGGPDFQSVPYTYPTLPAYPGKLLVDSLLPTVGANLPYRDPVDFYVINELLSYGKKGTLIADESQLPIGIPSSWSHWSAVNPTDTDGDGMPDEWEKTNGTNAQQNDAMTISANGYANIENYINSICIEDRPQFLRAPFCFGMSQSTQSTQSTLEVSWYDFTEGEEGFLIEMKKGADFVEVGRTAAGATSFVVTGLEPATAYQLRVKAFQGSQTSNESAILTVKTQPEQVEMVDVATFVPDFTWNMENGAWNFADACWKPAAVFTNSSSVLFAPLTDITVAIEETVSPSVVVIADDGNVTFNGAGGIGGSASVNKAGNGNLTMGGAHSYTGATVLHSGTVRFSSLKDGGVNSGIGASQEFAQYWVWDGGVWDYTGASTSTNRSAKIYRDTEFRTPAGATVTLNGSFEGNGGITWNGAGQVTANTAKFFSYEGPTRLAGGTFYMNAANLTNGLLGSSSKLILAGGTYKTKGIDDNYENYNFPIEAEDGTYSVFQVHRNCSINSQVSGGGTIEMPLVWLREYVRGNWDHFTGRLVANGTNGSADCQLMLYNGKGIVNGVVELKGNARVVCWSTTATYYLGGLSGAAGTYLSGTSKNTKTSKMTWIVGGAGTDETFNGIIDNRCSAGAYSGTTSIVKTGDGDWRLTGKNSYSGTTTVEEGRLIVNGTHTGTGAVLVKEKATLTGKGTLAGTVTVYSGGTLCVGDTLFNRNDVFTLSKNVSLNAGAILEIPLLRTGTLNRSSKIKFGGTVALNGTLQLDVTNVTVDYAPDTYFTLFDLSAATVSGQFASIVPAVPAAGLEWDLSALYTEGKLYVRKEGYTDAICPTERENGKVWPVCVENELNIQTDAATKVSLCSMQGKVIKEGLVSGSAVWNMSNVPSGIYLVCLRNGNQKEVSRIIKK